MSHRHRMIPFSRDRETATIFGAQCAFCDYIEIHAELKAPALVVYKQVGPSPVPNPEEILREVKKALE